MLSGSVLVGVRGWIWVSSWQMLTHLVVCLIGPGPRLAEIGIKSAIEANHEGTSGSGKVLDGEAGIGETVEIKVKTLDLQSHIVRVEKNRFASRLESEPTMLDVVAREDVQHTAYHDGNVMQQIGALLLELGRATLNLRMGNSPASLGRRLAAGHINENLFLMCF